MASSSGNMSRDDRIGFVQSLDRNQQRDLVRRMSNEEQENFLTTQLEMSAMKNAVDMVKTFMATGAKKNGALHYAINGGHKAVVNILLDGGADPTFLSYTGYNAQHVAVASNRYSIVKVLLQRNVSVDARNREGLTALYMTVQGDTHDKSFGYRRIVIDLIDAGASADTDGTGGKRPFHLVAMAVH
ncbi:unnamed protein product [Ectocarpus sp. 12 AP-2014]